MLQVRSVFYKFLVLKGKNPSATMGDSDSGSDMDIESINSSSYFVAVHGDNNLMINKLTENKG